MAFDKAEYNSRPENRAKLVKAMKRLHQEKQQYVRDYKVEQGCLVCGTKNWIVLELDHRNPQTKHFKLKTPTKRVDSRNRGGGKWMYMSWQDLKTELEKCDVLCANHHRIRTAWTFGWEKNVTA